MMLYPADPKLAHIIEREVAADVLGTRLAPSLVSPCPNRSVMEGFECAP